MATDGFKLVFTLLLLVSFIFVVLTISYYREETGGTTYQIAGKRSGKLLHQHVSSSRLWPDRVAAWNQGVNSSKPFSVRLIEGGGLKSITTNDIHRLDGAQSGRNIVTLPPMNYDAEESLSLVLKTSNLSSVANVTSTFREDTKSSLDSNGTSIYGKVVHGRDYTVVYNRVPKCGSRTFVDVAKMLAKHSHHGPGIPREVITRRMKSKIQRQSRIDKDRKPKYKEIFRERVSTVKVGTFLHGHVYYVDFNQDEMLKPERRPLYFNLIRDPIDRLVSQYYFVRNGDNRFTNLKKLHKLTKRGFTNETINDCVLRSRPECVGNSAQGIITRYFCGYDPECGEHSEVALQKAMHNLEGYVVVGVAEQYEDFLKVLEHLLPGYFRGIFDMYQKYTKSGEVTKSRAKGKIGPTDKVKDKLRTIMEMDYKFYNYTREKFNRLKLSLGIT